jgi:hypothetical protein
MPSLCCSPSRWVHLQHQFTPNVGLWDKICDGGGPTAQHLVTKVDEDSIPDWHCKTIVSEW